MCDIFFGMLFVVSAQVPLIIQKCLKYNFNIIQDLKFRPLK